MNVTKEKITTKAEKKRRDIKKVEKRDIKSE